MFTKTMKTTVVALNQAGLKPEKHYMGDALPAGDMCPVSVRAGPT